MAEKKNKSEDPSAQGPLGRTEPDASNISVMKSRFTRSAEQLAQRALGTGRYGSVRYTGHDFELTYPSGTTVTVSAETLSKLVDK